MKVINRSDEIVSYNLPEMHTRREFNPGESKNISAEELEMLFQQIGGNYIIKNYLLVEDRAWVKEHWDAPIEYFWMPDQVKNCLLNDDIELFTETLNYAPDGVLDLIKYFSYTIPITDLNKINAIQNILHFDVMAAIAISKTSTDHIVTSGSKQRLRREEL